MTVDCALIFSSLSFSLLLKHHFLFFYFTRYLPILFASETSLFNCENIKAGTSGFDLNRCFKRREREEGNARCYNVVVAVDVASGARFSYSRVKKERLKMGFYKGDHRTKEILSMNRIIEVMQFLLLLLLLSPVLYKRRRGMHTLLLQCSCRRRCSRFKVTRGGSSSSRRRRGGSR